MIVHAVPPAIDTNALLAGAQFCDAFSIVTGTGSLTARAAAERMLSQSPRWVELLLRLRDAVVAPLGLRTTASARHADMDKIGFFPVISEAPDRVVAGFNDSHLDFRIVIDVAADDPGQRITATTIVLTHNWLGRAYLTIIEPFHRLVVRAMLKQVDRPQ